MRWEQHGQAKVDGGGGWKGSSHAGQPPILLLSTPLCARVARACAFHE